MRSYYRELQKMKPGKARQRKVNQREGKIQMQGTSQKMPKTLSYQRQQQLGARTKQSLQKWGSNQEDGERQEKGGQDLVMPWCPTQGILKV